MSSARLQAALIALVLFAFTALPATAAPALNPKAAAGDCAACHKGEKVLPAGHPATKGMKLEACTQCHARDGAASLATRVTASHFHRLAGVGCVQCHGTTNVKKAAEVAHDKCMACHEPVKLAAKTASVKPKNPHDSPHYGKEADCNLCHRQHAKSENYCAQCHKFEFKVP